MLACFNTVHAQQVVRPVAHAVVNFYELYRQEQLFPPSSLIMQAPPPNEGDEDDLEVNDTLLPFQDAPVNNLVQVVSPSPVLTYMGAPDEAQGGGASGTYNIPPDTYGATGLDKIFVTINNNYKVLNKTTGAQISIVSMPSFWSSLGTAGSGAFDPRVIYDPYNNRWIHAAVSNAQNANSRVLLAISRTHDPNGVYDLYAFDPDAGAVNWADFPMLGFNKNWVAISVNLFTIAANANAGSLIFAIDYPALRTGVATSTTFTLTSAQGFCHNPAETYSTTENTLYVPSHIGSGAATYRLSTITGTPAAPVFTLGSTLTRTGGGWAQPAGNTGPQQCLTSCPGTLQFLDVGDAFIRSNAVYRNGEIWYAQAVGLPTGTFARVSTQWTRLNASTGAVLDGGRVDDATATNANGGRWYTYPSLSVNGNGDALAGFSKLESDGFAGAAYALRLSTDAAGTMQDPVVFKDGEDYYDKVGSGRARWGDYSHVTIDPLDDISFWTWQEYARPRASPTVFSTTAKWGTWVAKVAPKPCLSAATGNWNAAGTWGCGVVPTATEDVNIMSGHNVTLDVNPSARTITVNEGATLTLNAARTLSCKLIVYGTLNITAGSLTIGNNDVFISRNATLTGASSSRFFTTSGTGTVTKMIGGGTSFEFPLSANGTSYNGLVITLNAGDAEEVFSVRVNTGVTPSSGANDASCVQRTWNINEMTAGSNNANLTFKWTAADHGASFNPAIPAFAYRHNGSGYLLSNNLTTPVLASGVYSASTTTTVSTFSPWIVSSINNLPILFEYFTGAKQGNDHLLTWKLECDPTNRNFSVERSSDGRSFTAIGTVNITNGCLLPFSFTDNAPLPGKNYYRIRVNDISGRTAYSKVIVLLNQETGFELVGLYPSPVKSTASLQISVAQRMKADIRVVNAQGQVVQQFKPDLAAGMNQLDLNFSQLSAGNYFINVSLDKSKDQTIKFTKE